MLIVYIAIAIILSCAISFYIKSTHKNDENWDNSIAIFDGWTMGIAATVVLAIFLNIAGTVFIPKLPVSEDTLLYETENGCLSKESRKYTFFTKRDQGWTEESLYTSSDIYFEFTAENEAPYLETVKGKYASSWWNIFVFYENTFSGTEHYIFHIPEEEFPPEYKSLEEVSK